MTTPLQTAASYVPGALLTILAREARPPCEVGQEVLQSAVLSVGVRGLSRLMDSTGRLGPAGTAAFSEALNRCLASVIGGALASGGDVLEITGDGLLIGWSSGADSAANVDRAARVAAALAASSSPRELGLAIGLGVGQVQLSRVGGVLGQWRLVISGVGSEEASAAQRTAAVGRVACSQSAWGLLGDAARAAVLGQEAPALETSAESAESAAPGASVRSIRGFLPRAVRDRLAAGLSDWSAEQHCVTTVSIKLPGLSLNAPGGLERLQAAARVVQEVLYRHEGELVRVQACEGGVTVLCALGAPHVHEDDPSRGAKVAMSIREGMRSLNAPSAAGVSTGRAFCGIVGCDERRGFVLIGDAVELSSRLMSRATAGVILCDAATRGSAERVDFRALGSMRLQGVTSEVQVFIPVGVVDAGVRIRAGELPIQGRESERRSLMEGLDAHQSPGAGDCQVVALVGPAGMGKSRLLLEALNEARRRGFRALVGTADPVEQLTPLHAWRSIFREILGVSSSRDELRVAERLSVALGEGDAARLAPFINAIIPGALPESSWTERMEGEGRAEHTRSLLILLLRRYAAAGAPVVILLDDVHWMDSASVALLEALADSAPELFIALGVQPVGGRTTPIFERIYDRPGARYISVDPLPERAAARVAARVLGVDAIPTPLTRLLMDQTGGNPLYLCEMVRELRERGAVTVEGRRCALDGVVLHEGERFGLDSLAAVLESRLKRLSVPILAVALAASAFGTSFAEDEIAAALAAGGAPVALSALLLDLERAGVLIRFVGGDGRGRWDFVHDEVREVLYGMLSGEERDKLHATIADHLEAAGREGRRVPPAVLAHHWRRSGVLHKAVNALDAAGAAASRQDALDEGVRLYTEALEVGDGASLALRLQWRLRLGRAFDRRGQAERAVQHLTGSLKLLGQRSPPRSLLGLGIGLELARLVAECVGGGDLSGGARAGDGADGAAARTWLALARVQRRSFERGAVRYAMLRAANTAAKGSPERAVAIAALSCDASLAGRWRVAAGLRRRCEGWLTSLSDPAVEGVALRYFGEGEMARGRWVEARSLLRRAEASLERAGLQSERDRCELLRCTIQGLTGELDSALGRGEAVFQRGDRRRCTLIQVQGRVLTASLRRQRGDLDIGLRLLREAAELARVRGDVDVGTELLAQVGLGLALADAGNLGAASAVAAALDLDPKLLPCAAEAGSRLAELMTELSVRLWVRSQELPEMDVPQLRRRARRAARMLEGIAAIMPANRPAAARWVGRCLARDGFQRLALRRWTRGMAEAEALGMRRELAILHAEIARAGGGEHHLTSASAILETLDLDPVAVLSAAGLIAAPPPRSLPLSA